MTQRTSLVVDVSRSEMLSMQHALGFFFYYYYLEEGMFGFHPLGS